MILTAAPSLCNMMIKKVAGNFKIKSCFHVILKGVCAVDHVTVNIRRVNDQSVPLPFDVLLGGLLCHIQSIKLQPSRHFLLTFEDHQWNLSFKIFIIHKKSYIKMI